METIEDAQAKDRGRDDTADRSTYCSSIRFSFMNCPLPNKGAQGFSFVSGFLIYFMLSGVVQHADYKNISDEKKYRLSDGKV